MSPPYTPSSPPPPPAPRGSLSAWVLARLRGEPTAAAASPPPPLRDREPHERLADEDLQLTLYVLYELHYRGFAGVSEDWEWDPRLLALRAELERAFEDALRAIVPATPTGGANDMDLALREILDADHGPSLSRHLETRATLAQFREFAVHRSAYQLKEADPHSWALPRLSGRPKAAMVAIQSDEYGEGVPGRAHSEMFRDSMLALGLRGDYGAYLDVIPGYTLATVNLMSLFGLHRRWRGAIVGHLAAFEMSSSIPNGRYARGLKRLGRDAARAFFDEHVVADAVHENLAAVDLAGGLAADEPGLRADVLFGASALVALDRRFADALLDAWEHGRSSLREPLPDGESDSGPDADADGRTAPQLLAGPSAVAAIRRDRPALTAR